jgi:hypothetical protein
VCACVRVCDLRHVCVCVRVCDMYVCVCACGRAYASQVRHVWRRIRACHMRRRIHARAYASQVGHVYM